MKPDLSHIKEIRAAFEKLQTREDLLALLNKAKPLLYGKKAVPFQLKQLTWYANPKLGGTRYKEFKVLKKSGTRRCIHAPVKGLKSLQKTLGFILQCVYEPHNATMGFVRNRSVLDNAILHTGSNYVYNIDLRDFFTSIDQARVWKCLQLHPFNLVDKITPEENLPVNTKVIGTSFYHKSSQTILVIFEDETWAFISLKGGFKKEGNEFIPLFFNEDTGDVFPEWKLIEVNKNKWIIRKNDKLAFISEEYSRKGLANLIASICCAEIEVERKDAAGVWQTVKRNVLPQGAPSSPVLTNIVCQKLDFLLAGVAKRFGLKYSRYADDITFSSMHNVYQQGSEFLKELHRIIAEQNFQINESKTRLQKDGYRKEVTGLVVNEKPNVTQRYIKQLRLWLYYWERYGYERASGYFGQHYITDKGHSINDHKDMANVIFGKLNYLKMIKGSDNTLYLMIKKRFDALIATIDVNNIHTPPASFIEKVSKVGYENTNTTAEINLQNTNKLKLSIRPIGSTNVTVELKRKIIIDKGEILPHVEYIENNEKEEKEIDLSKHKPIDVYKFLKYFQTGKFKWLTHKYEEGPYDRIKILQDAKYEFETLTKSLIIPPSLFSRIEWFAFTKNPKFYFLNKFHYINWHSDIVEKWEQKNPNMHPINSDYLFKEMFEPFKKSIELKKGDLKDLLINQLANSLGNIYTSFDIEFKDIDNVNFYADVDSLKRGLSYLFNAIKQRSDNSKRLKLNYRRVSDDEGRKRILEIIHVDSFSDKRLDKSELLKGDLLAAEKSFFGVCDWSIISKSPDESVNKLNVLFDINSGKLPKDKIDDSMIEGFTHILTFYN